MERTTRALAVSAGAPGKSAEAASGEMSELKTSIVTASGRRPPSSCGRFRYSV